MMGFREKQSFSSTTSLPVATHWWTVDKRSVSPSSGSLWLLLL